MGHDFDPCSDTLHCYILYSTLMKINGIYRIEEIKDMHNSSMLS